MIKGFEQYTEEISPKDIEAYQTTILLLKHWFMKKGQDTPISNKTLRGYVKDMTGKTVSSPKMRKFIQKIRIDGDIESLAASSEGYYIATDQQDKIKYLKSLRSRANQIYATHQALAKQFGIISY